MLTGKPKLSQKASFRERQVYKMIERLGEDLPEGERRVSKGTVRVVHDEFWHSSHITHWVGEREVRAYILRDEDGTTRQIGASVLHNAGTAHAESRGHIRFDNLPNGLQITRTTGLTALTGALKAAHEPAMGPPKHEEELWAEIIMDAQRLS